MKNIIIIQFFKSPFGELVIGSFGDELCICDWKYRKLRSRIDMRICKFLNSEMQPGNSPVINNTIDQLSAYFYGDLKSFSLPLLFAGSEFQKLTWKELLKIPYGMTQSYLELADTLGDKNAVRAVANANGANAISIIVPCHRVVGSNGELMGYAGGLPVKKKLLTLEGAFSSNQMDIPFR